MAAKKRKAIEMLTEDQRSFNDVFEQFVASKTAKGVEEVTIRNYYYRLKTIQRWLDTTRPFDEITIRDIDAIIVGMRTSELSEMSTATYARFLRTFYNWCKEEGYSSIDVPKFKEKEVIKDTYRDEDLKKLLARPEKGCTFGEFRSWVMVNFLLNSGCRAATIRNIQNRDVDLDAKCVIYRHNKNGRVQSIPLCTVMVNILREYMKIRKGKPDDYLFCNVYGEMLTEDGLRHAICRYNKGRGVEDTSIHQYRHTFARKYLMDCDGDAFTLQRLLGHSTLAMTKHYCRIYDADIIKDYDDHSPLATIVTNRERIRK